MSVLVVDRAVSVTATNVEVFRGQLEQCQWLLKELKKELQSS